MFCYVEICDVHLLVFSYQNVAWFDVPVANSLLMHMSNAFKNLLENILCIHFVVFAHLSDRIQNFLTLNVLHHLVNLILELIVEHFDGSYNIFVI